ncbi:DUF2232 domain-containing protein, partial [Leptolyngbya cf. ectocarpi LEGE 11479]|nr:DUF2232 domain-containing protein [Leptolyngbya cf. ectocarpi LEGE 11479]
MGQPDEYQAETQVPGVAGSSDSAENIDDIDLDSPWIEDDEISSVTSSQAKAIKAPSDKGPVAMVETAFLASAASLMWLINLYFPPGPLLR